MDSVRFTFRGKTAHAAARPHKGRSALDAVMLMEVAVNFMREHIEDNARIHCVVTDGGKAPNVVPDRAALWYYIRGRSREQVDDLRRRVHLCARGAAMATETRCRMRIQDCAPERVPNEPMALLLDDLLHRFGPPEFTSAETRATREIIPTASYATEVKPILRKPSAASSDEDNVSWFAPLGRVNMACVPVGAVPHHRTFARLVRTDGARRGMLRAAEVLAAAAVELAVNDKLRDEAKADFRKNMKGRTYDLPA